MATLIGDYAADHSHFHHGIMAPSGLPYQQQHPHEPRYRSSSRSRDAPSRQHSSHSPRHSRPAHTPSSISRPAQELRAETWGTPSDHRQQPSDGSSRIPTPPDSSSPSVYSSTETRPQQHSDRPTDMASSKHSQPASDEASTSSTSSASTVVPAPSSRPPTQSIPSPASDDGLRWPQPRDEGAATAAEAAPTQKTIKITDLAHIQRLAQLDLVTGNRPGIFNDPPLQDMKFEISAMPIGDIIEMVAALLTKITTTNDLQHDALNRNATHQRQAQAQNEGSESHSSPYSTSVLAFHGKNVPAITILSYLSRIHKYCPTTYEVFLSLLVYFDRMTERVNDIVMKDEEARRKAQPGEAPAGADRDTAMQDSSDGDEVDEDLADSDDEEMPKEGQDAGKADKASASDPALSSATYFVVDSFNIHRLIIAGVTCASKFFSDVFYTNSRYAKVGGLPLAELNHLELQFLLLNDFRLAVPVEDLEAYATMLVEFYAREVVGQRPRPAAGSSES